MSDVTLDQMTVSALLDAVAAKAPTPGGGAVAAIVGALGAALGMMVVNYSTGRKSLASHAALHEEAMRRLAAARAELLQLARDDADAYARLNDLMKRPEDDARRQREWSAAVEAAIAAPRLMMASCAALLTLLESLKAATNRSLRSDMAIAAILADASARAAAWNVRINLSMIASEAARRRLAGDLAADLAAARSACERIESACEASGASSGAQP